MSAAFDTLDAARRLEDAGMDRKHAEAVATIVRDSQGELATAGQLKSLDDKVTTGFGMLRWMVSIYFAMTMAILATLLAHTL